MASPLLEQSAHKLVLDVSRCGLLVDGDPARLTQVVTNLLTNACKYTSPGGRIDVTATVDGDHVVICVRDNGIGITPEALPNIFDLFVQGRQASDRALGGLGLGLTIVKNLVEQHEGTVSAHSDGYDEGSEFIVRLPVAKRAAAAAPGPLTEPALARVAAPNGLRILVVDDNEDAAEMLAAALRLHGCEVMVAHDGPQALNLAAGHAFGAALLDIGLPVMDVTTCSASARDREPARSATGRHPGYGQDSIANERCRRVSATSSQACRYCCTRCAGGEPGMSHLVQLFLPLQDNEGQSFPASHLHRVRDELTQQFNGMTAYTRAPAEGRWQSGDDRTVRDDIASMSDDEELDRAW